MSRNFETQVCQWYGVKQIKSFFADKGYVVKQGLGHLFITLNSSHFYNKTDLQQYFFKPKLIFGLGLGFKSFFWFRPEL